MQQVLACASCGCGAGGYYLGLMPLQHRNYVGLRYRTALFHTQDPTAPAEYQAHFKTREYFWTTEAVGRVYLHPRLQLTAYLPYQLHRQVTTDATHATQGLGDALAFVNWRAFSNLDDTSGPAFRHALWVGAGVKTATGRYRVANAGERSVANANFMLGTGSWDPMLTLSYQVRRNRSGLALDASARYATENATGYAFGNRATVALSTYAIRQRRGWGYMPAAGLYLETSQADRRDGDKVDWTGGSQLAAQAGVDVFYGRITAGALGRIPLAQNLAGGSQTARPGILLQAGYAF